MTEFAIRPVEPWDREWISQLSAERWGSEIVVVHDTVYKPADLPGFVAIEENKRIGLITYHIENGECELVTLDSLQPSIGIGNGLIEEVGWVAKEAGCKRLWVITTNDNIEALKFYQRRGFSLVAVHKDAVVTAREEKPEIPQFGKNGIPIKDEIELEMKLD